MRDSTAFRVGETVDARWGGRYYAGTVDEVFLDEAGEVKAYEINWAKGGSDMVHASLVRAASHPVAPIYRATVRRRLSPNESARRSPSEGVAPQPPADAPPMGT